MASQRSVVGDISRGMASAPLGDKLKEALGTKVVEEVQQEVKEVELHDAAVQSSIEAAAATATVNPVAAMFGTPSFRLPDKEGVYKNDRSGTTSRRMAFVTLPIGTSGLELETSIYASEETKDGMLEQSFSISLPRNISVPKDSPLAQIALDTWKYNIVGSYMDWAERLSTSTPLGNASTRPRHVKRTAITAAAPAAQSAATR